MRIYFTITPNYGNQILIILLILYCKTCTESGVRTNFERVG
jgi:hypothetical protein